MEQTWGEGPREQRGTEGGESKGKGGRRIANKGGQTHVVHLAIIIVMESTEYQEPTTKFAIAE